VVGVGGLQALVKGGLSVENKEVIVCGSGPLLVAVASYLRRAGASVPMLLECVPAANLRSLAIPLLTRPTLLRQAMSLRWSLRGVRIALGAQVLGVEGSQEDKSLRWSDARGREFQTHFDWLACGFGLVPNLELASLLGCEMSGQAVGVDESLETSVRGVFAAGELLGIGGVECALIEGEIAGASQRAIPVQPPNCCRGESAPVLGRNRLDRPTPGGPPTSPRRATKRLCASVRAFAWGQ
ncbi:MAG: Hydrogen cyanide synthase subunit HcnB, partial [Armatimonadetes bacterium OLB18]